ncbi:MAG: PaaI family thioesterase [Chloroflexota bacterium]
MTKSKIDPQTFDIPDGFVHWPGDPAEDNLGPFFYRIAENECQSALRLRSNHCNIYGNTHGGILMALADYTLGLTAIADTDEMWVTVTCNNEFIAGSKAGELIIGTGELLRRTRSLAFVRATLRVDERVLLTASGVFKKVRAG